jgi:hypothetical protein
MPHKTIDYSNTIIYKLCCKDDNVSDIYVSHTTNFRQRKYFHKSACNLVRPTHIHYLINNSGGWENWNMIELAIYNCTDIDDAKKKVKYHEEMEKQKRPRIDPRTFLLHDFCPDAGDSTIVSDQDFEPPITALKQKTRIFEDHPQNVQSHCDCGKSYKYQRGLWQHRQKCEYYQHVFCPPANVAPLSSSNDIQILTNLVHDVVKQNQELTTKIVDICKTSITNQTNNVAVNSHNKTFNLQFFLNETCKHAMNITDFVDSLQLQLSDLETVGKLGYVDGISSIIVNHLNALDETARPIHCTDKKRETFYVKDEDKWEKEDATNNKLRKAIGKIACKNQRLLPKFKEIHPGCNYSESAYAEQYSKLVIESIGGIGCNDGENENKIIKKIAKEVTITK